MIELDIEILRVMCKDFHKWMLKAEKERDEAREQLRVAKMIAERVQGERDEARRWAVRLAAENNERKRRIAALVAENEALREKLLSMAGAYQAVVTPDRSRPFTE
jgi:hypothetical protein